MGLRAETGAPCPVGDRARPRTRVTVPRAADDRGGQSGSGEGSSLVPSRRPLPPTGTSGPWVTALGPGLGVARTPAPCSAPSWRAGRPPRTAPNRCSSSYSPALPGARPPATSATSATARRSSSAPRREAGTTAMSGPGGPEPRDARTQPGRRGCSRRPRPGALDL